MKPTADQRLWMYEAMYRSRRLDDAVLAAYMEGKTPVFHGIIAEEFGAARVIDTPISETVIGRDQVVGRIETA
jgi:TPP-dependent pyruvate/acetoin dehydrogenase alpha subunit